MSYIEMENRIDIYGADLPTVVNGYLVRYIDTGYTKFEYKIKIRINYEQIEKLLNVNFSNNKRIGYLSFIDNDYRRPLFVFEI